MKKRIKQIIATALVVALICGLCGCREDNGGIKEPIGTLRISIQVNDFKDTAYVVQEVDGIWYMYNDTFEKFWADCNKYKSLQEAKNVIATIEKDNAKNNYKEVGVIVE